MTTAEQTSSDKLEQKSTIEKTAASERNRLLSFIRRQVPNEADAEDILQDVFYQLVANSELVKSIEKMTSWLFTVARNKIIDLYRKRKPEELDKPFGNAGEDEDAPLYLTDILFDPDESPEEVYSRSDVWKALSEALEELPREQREVFVQHELEDLSFKEISEKTGTSVNTLLSRKRYAILHLRKRLETVYQEFINQ